MSTILRLRWYCKCPNVASGRHMSHIPCHTCIKIFLIVMGILHNVRGPRTLCSCWSVTQGLFFQSYPPCWHTGRWSHLWYAYMMPSCILLQCSIGASPIFVVCAVGQTFCSDNTNKMITPQSSGADTQYLPFFMFLLAFWNHHHGRCWVFVSTSLCTL